MTPRVARLRRQSLETPPSLSPERAVLVTDAEPDFRIELRITDASGDELFWGETSTARMKRSFRELAEWLVRDNPVPAGSVLLTGTGLVPADDFTLEPGHTVAIRVPGIGTLVNTVVVATDLLERSI